MSLVYRPDAKGCLQPVLVRHTPSRPTAGRVRSRTDRDWPRPAAEDDGPSWLPQQLQPTDSGPAHPCPAGATG